jgi:hypothetical protein
VRTDLRALGASCLLTGTLLAGIWTAGAGPRAAAASGATGPPGYAQAWTLYLQANGQVIERQPGCAPHYDDARAVLSPAMPQSGLIGQLAILRTPETAGDRAAVTSIQATFEQDARIYQNDIRIVRAADGHELAVVAARQPLHPAVPPQQCVTAAETQAATLAASAPADVRQQLPVIERRVALNRQAQIVGGAHDGVWITDYPHPPYTTGQPYPTFASQGLLLYDAAAPRPAFEGIAPDGVARITVAIPHQARYLGDTFTHTLTGTHTVPVRSKRLPHRPDQAAPGRRHVLQRDLAQRQRRSHRPVRGTSGSHHPDRADSPPDGTQTRKPSAPGRPARRRRPSAATAPEAGGTDVAPRRATPLERHGPTAGGTDMRRGSGTGA